MKRIHSFSTEEQEDLAQARIWQQKYADYLETIRKGSKQYKHFYGWMYTEIYRKLKSEN